MTYMSTISIILFILAGGVLILQIIMVVGWVAAVNRGAGGSVTFWPLMVSVVLAIVAVLTR